MTGPIDEAYVEIKPDLKDFDKEVKAETDKAFKGVERAVEGLQHDVEHAFEKMAATIEFEMDGVKYVCGRAFDKIGDDAEEAGRRIGEDIALGTKVAKHEIDDMADNAHHDFNRIERYARGSGFSISGIFSSIGKGVSSLFSLLGSLGSQIGQIGSNLGDIGGKIGSAVGSIGSGIGTVAQIALWGVLLPTALGLAGALTQLAGALAALPAAAGVAFSAILPLIFAFHGFADAIGAVMSNDPKKLNEALKGLSPSAAAVVREFQKLIKPFSEIQKIAQEALFRPLVGTLTQLANTILPALRAGVGPVASAFGNMFAQIAHVFTGAGVTNAFTAAFATTARIINDMTPSVVHLVEALNGLFVTGLPFVERFFNVISRGIDSFATWLTRAEQGGKVVGWLETAWHVGSLVWDVLKGVVQYLGTLLTSFSDEGTDTLNGMADALKRINEYFKTSKGQETLHNLGVIVHWAGNAFVFLLDHMIDVWNALDGLFAFIRGIGPFFASVGTWIKNAWNSVVDWTVNAWNNIVSFVTNAWNSIIDFFKNTGTDIGNFFSSTWDSIVNGVNNFITNTIAAIQAFPGNLRAFIVDAIHQAAYDFGYYIGLMVKFITTDFPNAVSAGFTWIVNQIGAGLNAIVTLFTTTIPNLASETVQWFSDMWDKLVSLTLTGVNNVISWLSALPGRVMAYVRDVVNQSIAFFERMWHTIVNFFRNLVNDVIDEARRLPGQVANAFSSFFSMAWNTGRDIVRGIVNGMESLAGWLYDQAVDLATRAWEGAKHALGINSPSKEFAKLGRWSVEGFAHGFDAYDLSSAIARSVKLPLTSIGANGYQPAPTGSPQVNVGGASLVAYLSIDGRQLHPVVVDALYDNTQDVALAAQQGSTDLSRRR